MRCVADTAATEANHRPDAGQLESATRFWSPGLGKEAVSEGHRGVRWVALAAVIWRPRASGFERGFG